MEVLLKEVMEKMEQLLDAKLLPIKKDVGMIKSDMSSAKDELISVQNGMTFVAMGFHAMKIDVEPISIRLVRVEDKTSSIAHKVNKLNRKAKNKVA